MSSIFNIQSFKNFLNSSTGGGIVLFVCVILSLVIANTPLAEGFNQLLSRVIGYENTNIDLNYSVATWVNDGLMAIFFFLVGLEIKREIVAGQLSSPRQAVLPIFAAIGGAIIPALIYTVFNHAEPTHHGWGIPMATDIAFALAVITMLGDKVPASLKVFLAALAIIDDLLAILVIAVFYSSDLHFTYLLYAAGIIASLIILNRFNIKNVWFYIVPGLFVWYFFHHSGIHATIAGVIVALCIPFKTEDGSSPLEFLEHILSKPVNFIIIPIFALANTNITLHQEMVGGLTSPLGYGIIIGLLLGKPLGILTVCWICIRSGLSKLPQLATWRHLFGVGLLAGIGFTMSIFISMLSFDDNLLIEEAKFSVLIGSLIAGLSGYFYLKFLSKRKKEV